MSEHVMADVNIDGVFQIPSTWKVKRIAELFNEVTEKYDTSNDAELPLLSVSEYYGVAERSEKIAEDAILVRANSLDGYKKCKQGDLVSNIMLTWKNALGISPKDGIVSPAYCVYRPSFEMCNKYYHYLFRTTRYGEIFKIHSTGLIDSRLRLYTPKFFALNVPYPPVDEQQAIANYLDEQCALIDGAIADAKASIEEYASLRASVIYETITKGVDKKTLLADSQIPWIGYMPETWSTCAIKHCTSKIGSGKTPSGGAEVYTDEGVMFLRSQNIYNSGLMLDDVSFISEKIDSEMQNTRVHYRDILLNITGGSIGRCCIFDLDNTPANVNQHVCILRTIPEKMLPEYLRYFWNSACGPMVVAQFQTGGNRAGLNFEQIGNIKVPLCSIDEQRRIVDYLDVRCSAIDEIIGEKNALISEFESYKRSLIYELVTGKRKVVQ